MMVEPILKHRLKHVIKKPEKLSKALKGIDLTWLLRQQMKLTFRVNWLVQVVSVRVKPFEGMSFQKMKLITIGLLYSEDFSEESKVKIYRAITVANSYPVDEQKYRLWESLTKEMWKRMTRKKGFLNTLESDNKLLVMLSTITL